ncbi:hypothetical protein Xekk_00167 [Xenorhabdus sp. KK7.4]|nr:hypothetical protein Xekk_00167 [Xenorhabdus sp. KK7.4]
MIILLFIITNIIIWFYGYIITVDLFLIFYISSCYVIFILIMNRNESVLCRYRGFLIIMFQNLLITINEFSMIVVAEVQ